MVLQSRRTASLSSFPFLPASPSLPTVSSSSSAAARLPPTYRRLLAVLILAVPAIWYWSSSPSTTSSVLPLAEERSIALSTLVGMAEAELATKQRAHALDDATGLDWDHAALGITLTEEEITLSAYQKSIRDTLRDVFGWTGGSLAMADDVDADGSPLDSSSDDPSPPHLAPPPSQLNTALDWWIASTLAHISLYQDPHHHLSPTSPSPHELFTTSSSTKLSSQFSMWKTLHPETSLRYFDQPSIDSWVKATFPSGLLAREWGRMEAAPRTKKDRRLLDAVRQDMWKALVVLQRAGMTVYADSDTGSVRPFGEWGKNDATSLTMPLLSLLPTLTAIPTNGEGMGEAKERPPSLVLSIEYDVTAGDEGWDRNTFDRGIQFALWTFAGSAGHPILVDYVGRAIRSSHASRAKTDLAESILKDWTGPGVFTDCVFRYLLARWGATPQEIGHHTGPVRVGDVLILPPRSFQADVSEHSTGAQDSVWHGFFPRWTPSELEKDDQRLDEDGLEVDE